MKITGKIMISIALLMMTLYGGGLCISHCACSGDASIYQPGDDGCCPEEDCMTVTVVQISDEYPAAHLSIPQPMPIMLEVVYFDPTPSDSSPIPYIHIDSKSPPDWLNRHNMVMTV